MKALLYFSISVALLAAVVIAVAAVTGHLKHECSYTHTEANPFIPGSGGSTKSCSWKIK